MSKPKSTPVRSNPQVTAAVQAMLRRADLPTTSRVIITPPKPKGR